MSTPETNLPPHQPQETAPERVAAQPEIAARTVPEDLRTPWGWVDLGIFILFGLASLLVLTNVLAALAVSWLGVKLTELEKFATTNTSFVVVRQMLWFGTLLVYVFATVRIRSNAPFWHTVGWRELRTQWANRTLAYVTWLLGGSALAIAIQFASVFVSTKSKLPIESFFQSRQSVLLLMAVGILFAPVVEETIFRGYIYPVLARSFGVAGGVLGTGVLFGLVHAPQLWGGWSQIALLALVGVGFTYARARTGTVVASYFLHLGYNSILFVLFYFSTGGFRHFPASP